MLGPAREFLNHEHSLFRWLGLKPLVIARGRTSFALTLPEEFADADGRIHGGLISIILDSVMGLTVYTSLAELKPIATVNLRIDQLGKTLPGAAVECNADVDAIAEDIAHVSGRITDKASGALIASAAGAFLVGTRGPIGGSRL
jgi:acyl-coenzyme A thioesterase PaaI-like protein